MKKTKEKDETLAIHAGQVPDPVTGSRAVPIYQTTSYVFNDTKHAARLFALKEFGNIYSRLMNPTSDVVEKRIATLEGGTAGLLTSSGMSAVFLAIHTIATQNDHIIASASLYGGTETLFRYTLPRIGIETEFIKNITPEAVAKAIRKNTKAIYIESLGNPRGDVPDIKGIAKVAHKHGLPLIVDNTFTPILCKPKDHGADIIIHSCTKWIGGHGTSVGGIIVDSGTFDWSRGRFPDFTSPDPSYHGVVYWDALRAVPGIGNIAFITKARVQGMRNIGMCASPFNAFLFLQGLETLPIRIRQQSANTLALAKWLKTHKKVAWVNYPGLSDHRWYKQAKKTLSGGFGAVLGVGLKGGEKAAQKFINSTRLTSHLANVGDAKTLVIHPASTTHQQLTDEAKKACGVSPEFVRVAVGLENIEDIKADFAQALAKC